MFGYGRNNFTWNGTLRELEGSCPAFCTERGQPKMIASPSSFGGLEVLLSSLQNSGDVESILNTLNVLDELLSAGTDRRIHYMISKGGSEALLTALVNNARTFNPNYNILLSLLHLLAKVGHRDRRIGMKAEEAGAVLVTLNLLKQNIQHAKRVAACLWVIQVFSSSVSTANLIGENYGLDVIYHLIPQYTTKNLHTIKAAINAFAALLYTKANVWSIVSKGYVSGLLKLYEDWHSKDTQHVAIAIRHALLCCLHNATQTTEGRQALVSQGGIQLLYQTTQTCLLSKCLECLVESTVQLMRKCLPKTPLPLTSDKSAYTFPLPGSPHAVPDVDVTPDESSVDNDAEEDGDNQEADSRDYVKCHICSTELSYINKSTSTMLRHYRARHETEVTNTPRINPASRKHALDQAVLNFILKDCQPLSMVERDGFRELLQVLEPSYVLPTRKTVKEMVAKKYEEERERVKMEVQKAVTDDDLETDLNKLCLRPDLDRPKELLQQYSRLCPELSHDFQELVMSSESEESSASSSSSDDEAVMHNTFLPAFNMRDKMSTARSDSSTSSNGSHPETEISMEGHSPAAAQLEAHDFHSHSSIPSTSPGCTTMIREATGESPPGQRRDEQDGDEEGADEGYHRTAIDRLLERHGACIPYHLPKVYRAAASKTKSIPGFSILAFPDFWGHLPPPGHEPMAPRKPNIQRQKVFEDVQRFLNTEDIINLLVFDLENSSVQCRSDSLRFFSKFECGNLRKAIQVRRCEYDLILNADVNCSQHTQWFYFEVSNMVAGVPYRFNVINCEKSNSQFNYGMQPVLYSVREALDGRPRWVRTGTEICYYRNYFCPAQGKRKTTFYTLTFTITFKHNEDVCYLAYHYPYTYSAMKAHLKVLQKSVDPAKVFFQQQILCGTLAGNSCPLVTITACPASKGWKDLHQLRNRPCIVLTGRVHPGESNASWVMKGTLEFLCSSDLVAQSLREAFVFKIIPMLNPDGVINGTNRCDVNSEDLNRQWCKPDPVLSPTIYHTKGFLYYLNSIGRTPLVFCDYHGHSRKKNVFLYGCSIKETLWQSGSAVDTVGLKEDPGYRTIPKTLDRIAPAFSFNSCNYLVEKSRSATARVVVWREIGVLRSYTMESTYNGCDQGIYKGQQIGTRELQEMGLKFCHSLLSVTKDMKLLYSRRLINHIDLDHNILDHNSHNCFEDDEPPCVEEIEYTTDFPTVKFTDLDSDVNSNMTSPDEEEEMNEGHSGAKCQQVCINESVMKGNQFPPHISRQASINALNEKRNTCNGVSIANGQITS